jgi:hypothetical protein
MIPAVQAVICGRRRVQVTKTFPVGVTSWTAPTTTSRIDSAIGQGAGGTPEVPSTPVQKTDEQYTFYRSDGTGADYQTVTVDGWPYGSSYYCDPYTPFDSPPYNAYYVCYRPYTDYVGGSDATTGASMTAFGQTFPGGSGGPATATTLSNVIVTPGATYSIVVPDGGSLTITYYQ